MSLSNGLYADSSKLSLHKEETRQLFQIARQLYDKLLTVQRCSEDPYQYQLISLIDDAEKLTEACRTLQDFSEEMYMELDMLSLHISQLLQESHDEVAHHFRDFSILN